MKAKIYHIFVDVILCFIDRIYAVDVLLLTQSLSLISP